MSRFDFMIHVAEYATGTCVCVCPNLTHFSSALLSVCLFLVFLARLSSSVVLQPIYIFLTSFYSPKPFYPCRFATFRACDGSWARHVLETRSSSTLGIMPDVVGSLLYLL